MSRAQIARAMGKRAERLIWELSASGSGLPKITTEFNRVFKTKVSQTAIYNYMQMNGGEGNLQKQVGFENAREIRSTQIKKILDIDAQLEHTNSKLNIALDSIDMEKLDSKMVQALVSLSGEIRKQLEFHKKYVEQVMGAPDKVTLNVNYSEAALLVGEQLESLEKEGFIKILKPFGKPQAIEAEFKVKNQKD